ncbi:MAG: PRC-barrel domain-containing protein [Candidatus Goldiibacteriota bacterium]
MLKLLTDINGYKLKSANEDCGTVKDSLFDDLLWFIRYFVVDTGEFLKKKEVIVSPAAVKYPIDGEKKIMETLLSKTLIEASPDINEKMPVSRAKEKDIVSYFQWPIYWNPGTFGGPAAPLPEAEQTERGPAEKAKPEPGLRSAGEVKGYKIKAEDGGIGHIDDFIYEDETWEIKYAVIATKNILPGKKVIVDVMWLQDIIWEEKTVIVDLPKELIEKSPPFDPNQPVNREYEIRLYDYYGRPKYWEK